MASTMQLGVLADLLEGRARRMWPGRWPERPVLKVEAEVEAEAEDRAQLVADLAALAAEDWGPLLAAVRQRKFEADTA